MLDKGLTFYTTGGPSVGMPLETSMALARQDQERLITARWEQGYTQAELDDAHAKFGLVFPPTSWLC